RRAKPVHHLVCSIRALSSPYDLILTHCASPGFITGMKIIAAALGSIILARGIAQATEEPRIVEKVTSLPVALSKDFEFRKTKLYFLSEKVPKRGQTARQTTSTFKPGTSSTAPSQR